MNRRIVIINPNSSEPMTRDISTALDPLRSPDGPALECVTLHDGPPAIETQLDIDDAAVRVRDRIGNEAFSAAAFVIACFSDPGLDAARTESEVPVFGIGECAMLTAMALGSRIGVISILEASTIRHARQFERMGIHSRIATDISVGTGVAGLGNEAEAADRLRDAGVRLRDQFNADVIVLACAGMSRYRPAIQEATGLPAVDPTQAAAGFAIASVRTSC